MAFRLGTAGLALGVGSQQLKMGYFASTATVPPGKFA